MAGNSISASNLGRDSMAGEMKYGVDQTLQWKERIPNRKLRPGEWVSIDDWNKRQDMTETDPNGIPAKQPGSKLDSGKSPVMQGVLQYFPRAILEIAKVSQAGAAKYTWKGW